MISESGLSLLHTYFTVDLSYHSGRMLKDNHTIQPEVADNFTYLSSKINKEKIWNPTLSEMIDYLNDFFNLELDIDSQGQIKEISNTNLIRRAFS